MPSNICDFNLEKEFTLVFKKQKTKTEVRQIRSNTFNEQYSSFNNPPQKSTQHRKLNYTYSAEAEASLIRKEGDLRNHNNFTDSQFQNLTRSAVATLKIKTNCDRRLKQSTTNKQNKKASTFFSGYPPYQTIESIKPPYLYTDEVKGSKGWSGKET